MCHFLVKLDTKAIWTLLNTFQIKTILLHVKLALFAKVKHEFSNWMIKYEFLLKIKKSYLQKVNAVFESS